MQLRLRRLRQVVPLLAVDVLKHPAILGYTVSKCGRRRAPHLYLNGSRGKLLSSVQLCKFLNFAISALI